MFPPPPPFPQMASDGFLRLTEYPREEICGRNCRFLQGPSSDQVAVNNIRTALQAGRPCCEAREASFVP